MKKFLFLLLILSSCLNNDRLLERLDQTAVDLLNIPDITDFKSNQNHPTNEIVNIGPDLYELLKSRKAKNKRIRIQALEGDVSGHGGNVSHSILYFALDTHQQLTIRLNYDRLKDEFHIVGYTGKID